MRILDYSSENMKEILGILSERAAGNDDEYEIKVRAIVEDVRKRGDEALFEYTSRFDNFDLNASNIRVTRKEIEEAYDSVGDALKGVLERSAKNIREFHEHQKRSGFMVTREDGTMLGQRVIPMEYSGVYVPGGKAAYPSSVLMNIIPAKVAGVKEIFMATPPSSDGSVTASTLVAADIAGTDTIYRMGGAQAIAALAYGTESVRKVDKITGPGNIYVALAKKACFGAVSIDSIAGPSEILVLADGTVSASFAAADLLSQAEHDEMASAVLITTDRAYADEVLKEIERFLPLLERKDIIRRSLDDFGFIIIAPDTDDAVDAANQIASEHLELLCENPYEIMPRIIHAGAIFMGPWSSEPLGDYYAGPNHILPTNRTARFFSALSVDDFVKKTSLISYSGEALRAVHEDIELFAAEEGLTAHANSIRIRFDS